MGEGREADGRGQGSALARLMFWSTVSMFFSWLKARF